MLRPSLLLAVLVAPACLAPPQDRTGPDGPAAADAPSVVDGSGGPPAGDAPPVPPRGTQQGPPAVILVGDGGDAAPYACAPLAATMPDGATLGVLAGRFCAAARVAFVHVVSAASETHCFIEAYGIARAGGSVVADFVSSPDTLNFADADGVHESCLRPGESAWLAFPVEADEAPTSVTFDEISSVATPAAAVVGGATATAFTVQALEEGWAKLLVDFVNDGDVAVGLDHWSSADFLDDDGAPVAGAGLLPDGDTLLVPGETTTMTAFLDPAAFFGPSWFLRVVPRLRPAE